MKINIIRYGFVKYNGEKYFVNYYGSKEARDDALELDQADFPEWGFYSFEYPVEIEV